MKVTLAPGLILFQSRLNAAEQQELWAMCRALAEGPVPMYTPTVRGGPSTTLGTGPSTALGAGPSTALGAGPSTTLGAGKKMSVGMLCLGKHWNALSYKYEARRSDFDGLPVPPVPARFAHIAKSAAADAGFTIEPDICIMNFYSSAAKMGVHQDKDERPETIAAGIPIVSVSLGDDARFVVGGLSRREPTFPVMLKSGDVIVMGGPSRLRYHGVTRIVLGSAPHGTGPGRYNLTFRQW